MPRLLLTDLDAGGVARLVGLPAPLASGDAATRGFVEGVAADLPFLVPASGEWILTTTGAASGGTGTIAGIANRAELYAWTPRATVTLDQLALNVTTAVAGALARLVAYGSDASGRPDALMAETADLDLSVGGVRAAALAPALTFERGRTYWLGVRHSSTATVSAWSIPQVPDINGGQPATTARKNLRRTILWAQAAPSPWGWSSAEINSNAPAAVWGRIA